MTVREALGVPVRAACAFGLVASAGFAEPPDGAALLDAAEARYAALSGYAATVVSVAADGERRSLRYAFRRPGWVRMDFLGPHVGAVLVFDPTVRRVRLWPFGVDRKPVLELSPDNPLLRDRRGHRIDRSDVGALLEHLQALRHGGRVVELDASAPVLPGAFGVEIVGAAGRSIGEVARYRVWFERATLFPVRVESYDARGAPVEAVTLDQVERDVAFPDAFFRPGR
ncbi:LolA family protein [Crenobacter luteus]|uniref:LolA family protein n=1 Tax=Crenobacter luteus TaxID=1452487 RepID=UPI0018D3A38D|nr:hypothetical protein [Crenobacter luteus]